MEKFKPVDIEDYNNDENYTKDGYKNAVFHGCAPIIIALITFCSLIAKLLI